MVTWHTNFNTFQMYKRIWVPVEPNARTPYYLGDSERLHVQKNCAFLTFVPVGTGLNGITGDMDEAIALQGLEKVIGADLPKLIQYARKTAPPIREHVTEVAFLTAFTKTANLDGEIIYVLRGVLHADSRLLPAIMQI
jgi:hypothetical protein